ncbi:MAG: hypothetical protein OJF55_000948 [Rhodanobacteraceae bacterium]|jgi:hypothetical protein|nr:MAG: hypothetical protein OJF55_000948 [Rhodanobacteraceae bacterium]
MPRVLPAAALFILASPLLAVAQNPAVSARPHPAPSAHANAVAGQADAARIEACTHIANAMVDNLEKGDAKAATADFDATMRTNLGADKLGAIWKQVGGQVGKLQGHGTPQNMMYQGYAVIILPLRFEKGGLDAQVACDADGKVAGFFLRPGAAPSDSAPASGG